MQSEEDDNITQTLLHGKLILMFAIFTTTILSSFLPFFIKRKFSTTTAIDIITVGSCFTAGIIIGAGFSHLLPDSIEAWEEYFSSEVPGFTYAKYPWASLLSIFTLFVLIFIDKEFVDKGVEGEDHSHDGKSHNHMVIQLEPRHTHKHHKQVYESVEDSNNQDEALVHRQSFSLSVSSDDIKDEENNDGDETESVNSDISGDEPSHNLHKKKHVHKLKDSDVNITAPSANAFTTISRRKALSRAIIFLVALSMHSLFDGLGIGAENEENEFYGLIVAVAGHKLLDGFALGVPLFYADLTRRQIIVAVLFCASMTPLGIGIGMIATAGFTGSSVRFAKAFILSISAGSFFFISLMELLPSGLVQGGKVKTKLAAAFIGWAIMALLALWA